MRSIELIINGRRIVQPIEPRTHLADLLREQMNLTGTHLRCEQGVCGACTLLVDGQPARSCITYAVLCEGATVTTIEGLENDPIIEALRRAFSIEHGLQCGYCTPGMLVTARDIVRRLPDADEARIRLELSGNLCRCTGYVGIVRAISRVLNERKSQDAPSPPEENKSLGPAGAQPARPTDALQSHDREVPQVQTAEQPSHRQTITGLGTRQPNIEIRQSFTVSRAPAEVWAFFADVGQVASCLPGASVTRVGEDGSIEGKFVTKLGPITATFQGEAQITRDDTDKSGVIVGNGRDRLSASRVAGEVQYVVTTHSDGTEVQVTIRALLAGPLAQFGRSGIVEDLASRITRTFAENLEARLTGAHTKSPTSHFEAGAVLRKIILERMKAVLARVWRTRDRE